MKKDDFYQELDKKKASGICTCQTMGALFVFLFVVIVLLIWLFLRK